MLAKEIPLIAPPLPNTGVILRFVPTLDWLYTKLEPKVPPVGATTVRLLGLNTPDRPIDEPAVTVAAAVVSYTLFPAVKPEVM